MRNVLVIDVGGTHIKFSATGEDDTRKVPSGLKMTAEMMVNDVLKATEDWKFDLVAIGYPGPVHDGKPTLEPHNLAPGWVAYDFEAHFQKPVKVVNDAVMQAVGSYEGGRMLFLGLGTGLGSAMVTEKTVVPMELAHLPYRKGRTFEDYIGLRGLERRGVKKWRKSVLDVVTRLKNALLSDYVVLGGGNVAKLKEFPEDSRPGNNHNAILGGFRLWDDYKHG